MPLTDKTEAGSVADDVSTQGRENQIYGVALLAGFMGILVGFLIADILFTH